MKTTIEIPDALLHEAQRVAKEKGITLKSLVESGLRKAVEAEQKPRPEFRLRKKPFRGHGLAAELKDADWSEIRARVYEGRGG